MKIKTIVIVAVVLCSGHLRAQEAKDISKDYLIVSAFSPLPDNKQQHFTDVDFRYGMNKKAPYKIAIQFTNHGYATRKLKFAIKDVTAKKMVVLDAIHNSNFGFETLKPVSGGNVWSGPIDNIKDSFSLRVWDSDGDEFDAVPASVSEPR